MKRRLLLFALLLLISGAMQAEAFYTISLDPSLVVSPSSLSDFTYTYGGGPSSAQTLSVTGSDLTSDVTVTSTADFEISLNAQSGYGSQLTLSPNNGALTKTVYVRMAAGLSVGSHNGSLTIAYNGLDNIVVSLSGTVVDMPVVQTPSFSPAGGTYHQPQTVSISCATQGATIRYTLNGEEPTVNSQEYTSPLSINQTTTVKAKAWKEGYQTSQTATATYTIEIPQPSLTVNPTSLSGFTYTYGGGPSSAQTLSVTGSDLTSDVTVTSTADFEISLNAQSGYGSQLTLSPNNGALTKTVYVRMAAGLSVGSHNGSLTIAYNGLDNIVVSLSGTVVDMPVVQTPSFSPAGGTYHQPQTVSISCATQGATIRYTLNGEEPTVNSQVYTSPLSINQTTTVKAKAWKNGYQTSQTATATYIINITYTISVSANPTNGGSVTGGGNYQQGQQCTVSANANSGYAFTKWTENGNVVSTNANYSFQVTGNRTLVAHFVPLYTITVSASPSNGGTVTGGGQYQQGQQCTVSASANSGYAFTNWTENGNVVSTNASYTFTVTGNRTLVAHFVHLYTISISANPTNGGTVTGGGTYPQGTNCTVHATANSGYIFTNWTENGNVVSDQADYSFTVNNNRTLVAHFVRQYTINVSANPTNGGSVTGGGTYNQGDYCTVIATANEGFAFTNWTENGDVVSENANYSFTVNCDRILVANFSEMQPDEYNIQVSPNPSNGGMVSGGGIYHEGDECTVIATANEGYKFSKWTENGDDVSTEARYTFTVERNRTLVAMFEQKSYTITVTANPEDGGTVTGWGTYAYGATCILTATPNPGYTFTNWKKGNVIESTEPIYSFEVTEDASYTATFTAVQQYTITVMADPEDGGMVSGGGTYEHGVICELQAIPAQGYQFHNWTRNGTVVSTDPHYSFEVVRNETYIAHFSEVIITYYTITTEVVPEYAGMVTGGGQYPEGSNVTLRANANEGYLFTGWKEDGNLISTNPVMNITVTSDRTIVAYFAPSQNSIQEPDPICSGESLTLIEPSWGMHGEWQISQSESFEQFITYTGQPLDASYNGWYLRYHSHIGSLEWNSNVVQITVNSVEGLTLEGDEIASIDQEVEYEVNIDGDNNYGNYSFDWSVSDEQAITISTGNSCKVTWRTSGEQRVSVIVIDNTTGCSGTLTMDVTVTACIADLQEIEAKEHTVGNDTYDLILVYPNPNNEDYKYQWCYSEDGENYSDLKEGTYNKQYYYKGGRLKEGYYKVRVSKNECSEKTEPYHVSGSHLRIYPNPSRRGNEIIVMNDCDGQAQLTIYTTDGRVLHTQTVTDSQAIIDISLPQGIYVAYLTDSNGYTKVGKLIIQ